jgi:hypothetical protein
MEARIGDRKLPRAGLKELRAAVQARLPWVTSFSTLAPEQRDIFIDEATHSDFNDVLYSALYVYVAQGRLSGELPCIYVLVY